MFKKMIKHDLGIFIWSFIVIDIHPAFPSAFRMRSLGSQGTCCWTWSQVTEVSYVRLLGVLGPPRLIQKAAEKKCRELASEM